MRFSPFSSAMSDKSASDPDAILNSLPHPVLTLDKTGQIIFMNSAAEFFFDHGAGQMLGRPLADYIPFGSPLLNLVDQISTKGGSISEYQLDLSTPGKAGREVDVQVTALAEEGGSVLIMVQERTIAAAMDRQLIHRGAARSVSAMAMMLAHEIKNPLSGIRGAAQLLEQNAADEDRPLTTLIRDEVDRIRKLVDRMEFFSDSRPLQAEPVNIHEVLNHVQTLAENGFGAHVQLIDEYDPSLPPVAGDRDQLIQTFLNLVKNACEAVPRDGGEVRLTTAYRHGMRVGSPGSAQKLRVPIQVCIQDNGPGVTSDMQDVLFDPFVTGKPNGQGLGLALVAKVIENHGGIVECDSEPKRTTFRVLLPMYSHRKV